MLNRSTRTKIELPTDVSALQLRQTKTADHYVDKYKSTYIKECLDGYAKAYCIDDDDDDDMDGHSMDPAVAKEANLALIQVRSIDDDDGFDAARMFAQIGFGKKLTTRIYCALDGKHCVTLLDTKDESGTSINEELVSSGLALSAKKEKFDNISATMSDN